MKPKNFDIGSKKRKDDLTSANKPKKQYNKKHIDYLCRIAQY